MDLIKERDKRTIRRKIAKSKFDNMITLSTDADYGIRILDEGTVVTSDGGVWFYIEKGALQRYLDSLDDDFVGYIKPFHIEFENFGLLVGQFKKSDMTLVDIGDDRKSLYVKPTWFKTHLLEDLKAMPYDLSVSVEMECWCDYEATESLGFSVYKDVFIDGFAIVGDGGNVNSNGVRLNSGGEKVAFDFKKLNEALDNQSSIDLKALAETIKKLEADGEPTDAPEANPEAETEHEPADKPKDEGDEGVSLEDVLAKVTELTTKVEDLTKENKKLSDQVKALESDKANLSSELSEKDKVEKEILTKFKNLSLSLADTKPEVKEVNFDAMDAIGGL